MPGPVKRSPPRRHLEATVADPVKTKKLAERVRREVAFEKASDVVLDEDDQQAAIVVVLPPDGVPRVAETLEPEPPTRRFEQNDADRKRRR